MKKKLDKRPGCPAGSQEENAHSTEKNVNKLPGLFWLFSEIYETLLTVKATNMKQEKIFEVTFTNDSTVFIKAMDEEHAKRIVERNGTQWLSAELTVEMIIKSIKECE